MNKAGIVTILVLVLAVELQKRDGLTPWKTLAQAANGELVLPHK